jgi:hypothetical protein
VKTGRALPAALLVTLVLWQVPYGWILLYPFKIFATWLHESSHALLMLLTGAGVDRLELFSDSSGLAYPARGVTDLGQAFISSAGYVGTAAAGSVFMILSRTARGARWVLAVLALLMALSAAVMVRNQFGLGILLGEVAVLLAVSRFAGEDWCVFLVSLLAAQSCINAVLDIRVLFGASMYVNGSVAVRSDADVMAEVTSIPAAVWAVAWLIWSFGLFYLALRLSHRSSHGGDKVAR